MVTFTFYIRTHSHSLLGSIIPKRQASHGGMHSTSTSSKEAGTSPKYGVTLRDRFHEIRLCVPGKATSSRSHCFVGLLYTNCAKYVVRYDHIYFQGQTPLRRVGPSFCCSCIPGLYGSCFMLCSVLCHGKFSWQAVGLRAHLHGQRVWDHCEFLEALSDGMNLEFYGHPFRLRASLNTFMVCS